MKRQAMLRSDSDSVNFGTEADPFAALEAAAAREVARIAALARRTETPCGDGTMAWHIWGDVPGHGAAPVVLAHGAQGSWTHWIRQIEVLSARGPVIAADLPGHGLSAMPASEDHAGFVAPLAQGLATVLDGVKADFVGFSFGGVLFAHLVARHPELARRLVLVDAGGLDTPRGDVRMSRIGDAVGEARRAAIRANLCGLMLHSRDSADDLALHIAVANARQSRFKAAPGLVLPDGLLRALPDIDVQLDAIWGEHDRPHPDPALQAQVIRRFQPGCTMQVIAGAGHWAMYERAEAFNAGLCGLLDTPLRGER
jgi:pimeloyl-ACP methyl ester carboxylesterase